MGLDQLVPSVAQASNTNVHRFLEAATNGFTRSVTDKAEAWYKALGADARFALADPNKVVAHARDLFRLDSTATLPEFLDSMNTLVGAGDHMVEAQSAIIDRLKKQAEANGKRASGMYEKWSTLPSGHKMDFAMSGTVALLSAFGCIRSAQNSVYKDETGSHFVWSNAAISALQGMLAIFSGCLAVGALRSGHSY